MNGHVDVWLIALDAESAIVLSPDEELRAARFRFESDRVRWMRAHSGLRTILAGSTGMAPLDIQFVLGPHGKPSVAGVDGVEFSLSHAGDWAMVAVTAGVPVGIDIERIRENVDMAALLRRLGERDLPTGQVELFRAWTRREAVTKAAGGALLDAPSGDFRIRDLDAPEGYSAAVALIGHEPLVLPHGTVPALLK